MTLPARIPLSPDERDLRQGAEIIPEEVQQARLEGIEVRFVQGCMSAYCWYWEFPDGHRTYHFPVRLRQRLEKRGRCARCGNPHINGGRFDKNGMPLPAP